MNNSSSAPAVKKLTVLALFSAIVFLLQLLGSFIRFGTFSVSLVLLPVVLGAALSGPLAGAWLGFVFGIAVLVSGDASVFLAVNPFGTVVTVLAKGILCGFFAALVYRLTQKLNRYLAVILSAIVCPIVNTGVFLALCTVFFMPTITEWAQGTAIGTYMIVGLVGLNFVFELLFNIFLCPVILRLIGAMKWTEI